MTAAPIVPARTVVLRQRPAEQLEQVPSAYDDEPPGRHTVRYRETHRTGSLLPVGLRPPSWARTVLWVCVVVAAVAVTARLVAVLW